MDLILNLFVIYVIFSFVICRGYHLSGVVPYLVRDDAPTLYAYKKHRKLYKKYGAKSLLVDFLFLGFLLAAFVGSAFSNIFKKVKN